jgi:HemY protein
VHALFDMQCRARDWQGALETLAVARSYKHLDRKTLDRRRAVLLTAQAMELQDAQPVKALELAAEAHRLAPNLVPAANLAGRLLAGQGATYKAARVIARSWQVIPHPDLATAYAFARPGDSPRDRLARMKTLAALTPNHPEARVALAAAACDAHEWEEARAALQPLTAANPTARVCALMARIEGSQKRDAGRVREWLARAVRAPRDPVWMADGIIASEWAPISPVTGQLDAFEWRTPPDSSKAGGADHLLEDMAALSRELETVTRAIPEVSVISETRGTAAAPAPIRSDAATVIDQAPASPPPAAAASAPVPTAIVPVPSNPAKEATAAPVRPTVVPNVQRPDANTGRRDANTRGNIGDVGKEKDASSLPAPARNVAPLAPAPVLKRAEPKIFVPDRPPDDPGPEPAEAEDEAQTPLARFRATMKQHPTG